MIELFQTSALEKVMLDFSDKGEEYTKMTALCADRISYQIAFKSNTDRLFGKYEIESELKDFIRVYKVVNVPSELAAYPAHMRDDDYLSVDPGVFPDVLFPLDGTFDVAPFYWHSLWITVDVPETFPAGKYPITFRFTGEKYNTIEKTMQLEIIDAVLPDQTLIFTQWLHCDCIASFYDMPIFSEEHWHMVEKFVRMAIENGINMILTPIFTPPLDTMRGGQRPTVQLVDVFQNKGTYTFGFDKLDRFISLCLDCGVQYFEMAHLFTQWGAEHAPKIIAEVDGEEMQLFGWHTDALSEEYISFLDSFLPALVSYFIQKGIFERVYFHISDEPPVSALDIYMHAKSVIQKHVKGRPIMDALSDYNFYKTGAVTTPVVATNHIHTYLEHDVPGLWAYYCCSQGRDVGNRFMSMPSYRNRILGVQLYKYGIKGFLHWGYNFYYSQYSRDMINPFMTTDALGAFPSGDAFSVYPGQDGPLPSLRLFVFADALQDMRALQLLEKRIGRAAVLQIINQTAQMEITFENYPRDTKFLLKLREKINKQLKNKKN